MKTAEIGIGALRLRARIVVVTLFLSACGDYIAGNSDGTGAAIIARGLSLTPRHTI